MVVVGARTAPSARPAAVVARRCRPAPAWVPVAGGDEVVSPPKSACDLGVYPNFIRAAYGPPPCPSSSPRADFQFQFPRKDPDEHRSRPRNLRRPPGFHPATNEVHVTTKPPGRTGTAWWRARQRVLDRATHCAICKRPLDFDAKPKSSWAPSVDHIIPVSKTKHLSLSQQRDLAVDPSNLRAVHFGCNASRGAGRARKPTLAPEGPQPPMRWSRWWASPPPQGVIVGSDPKVYFPGDPRPERT